MEYITVRSRYKARRLIIVNGDFVLLARSPRVNHSPRIAFPDLVDRSIDLSTLTTFHTYNVDMLESQSHSKHNSMLGYLVKHPKSTNYEEAVSKSPVKQTESTYDEQADDIQSRPAKRVKPSLPEYEESVADIFSRQVSPDRSTRVIPDSDADSDSEDIEAAATSSRPTDLESALPPIKTDKEAIRDYEIARAAQNGQEDGREERLSQRKWIKGIQICSVVARQQLLTPTDQARAQYMWMHLI